MARAFIQVSKTGFVPLKYIPTFEVFAPPDPALNIFFETTTHLFGTNFRAFYTPSCAEIKNTLFKLHVCAKATVLAHVASLLNILPRGLGHSRKI
jgi:hypothetical protein